MTGRSTFTSAACGVVTGVLAVAVLPAVAAPAHAAPATITAAEAVKALRDAAAETRRSSLQFGSRATADFSLVGGGENMSLAGAFTVDPARGLTFVRVDVERGPAVPEGVPPLRRGNPCLAGEDPFALTDDVRIAQAGVGTYVHLGSPAPRYVKQGRRIIDRPDAQWKLNRDRSRTLPDLIARDDVASDFLGLVADPGYAAITSATSEAIPIGTRYTVEYESPDPAVSPYTGKVVVDVHEGGPVHHLSLADTVLLGTSSLLTTVDATYTYGKQTLAVPEFSTVVYPKPLKAGCTAALTRATVKETATTVAQRLNRGKSAVTEAKVRKAVKRELRRAHRAANVKKKVVDGGVRLTGRHRFIVPVVRTVVVVDGKAVVRKGA